MNWLNPTRLLRTAAILKEFLEVLNISVSNYLGFANRLDIDVSSINVLYIYSSIQVGKM